MVRLPAVLWSAAARSRFRPVALAAAAMVVVAFAFFANTHTASGLSVRQISEAVRDVENLHVLQYAGDRPEPVQELWMARTPGLILLINAGDRAFYDIKNRRKTIQRSRQGTIETDSLAPEERANIEDYVDSILGLASAGAPVNRELRRLTGDALERVEQDSEVYELTWESSSSGSTTHLSRLTVFLDPTTRLPKKTQMFQSVPTDENEQQWLLAQVTVFEYPRGEVVDLAVKGASAAR